MAPDTIREAFNALGTANILRRLTLEQQRSLLDLFTRSAGEMLDEQFESDLVKALFGFDAIVGNYASPYAAGSAYVMLHHAFGEVNGKKGVWGHAIGGMGAITQAMAAAARGHGAEIELEAGVREVIVERDRAVGVDPRQWRNHPRQIRRLQRQPETAVYPAAAGRCAAGAVPRPHPELAQRLRHLPDERRAGSPCPRSRRCRATAIISPPASSSGRACAYMDRAWQDAREHGWSRQPVVEVLIPSTLDDTLCPPGQHVASLFCQHVAPQLPDGKSWDDHREEVADLMIATVDSYAPGFAASVIGRQILSPLDLERQFGLLGGDIFHGALTLEPVVLGAADARPCRLSRTAQRPLPLRQRRASRRRRHRRPRPQRRACDPGGSPGAVWVKGKPRPQPRDDRITG